MYKILKKSIAFILLITLVLVSCKKHKAENSLSGVWIIDSVSTIGVTDNNHPLASGGCGEYIVFSGRLDIDDNGNGRVSVYGYYCGSNHILLEKEIENLHLIDHSGDYNFNKGYRVHWYQGYFNSNVYFDCKSLTNRGIINQSTESINMNIGGVIDQNTGGYAEEYNLDLILIKQ